jgi:hypothetical protein
MNIRIHIERLILEGLPITHSQVPLVQAAVESELARLLTENGLGESLQAGGAMPSVRANGMQLASGSKPAQIGTQIAQSVYSGIGDRR